MRLVLAGPAADAYVAGTIAPLIDGRLVEYIGPVYGKERNDLLAGASALLYPITASEPFGLVPIEAMACGTPVAAIDRGAVPEIVENGITGYATADLESLAQVMPEVVALDRVRVRQRAVERFDYRRMVSGYESVYRRLTHPRRRRMA
jgi:glycosyltransferase involved in cell wall biosynthesis